MTRVDRAASVREAMRRVVAERGLHGASMSAIASEADVATGTAYVHYASKEELLFAAYLELKAELGVAAARALPARGAAEDRFAALWQAVYAFVAADPTRARFLVQLDASPLAAEAHARAMAVDGDPLMAAAADLGEHLVALPLEVIYDLAIAPAVRVVASGTRLTARQRAALADACWRSISR